MALSWLVSNAIGEAIDQLCEGVLVDGEARAHRPTVLIFFPSARGETTPAFYKPTHPQGKDQVRLPTYLHGMMTANPQSRMRMANKGREPHNLLRTCTGAACGAPLVSPTLPPPLTLVVQYDGLKRCCCSSILKAVQTDIFRGERAE
jgi:hypothetical protein